MRLAATATNPHQEQEVSQQTSLKLPTGHQPQRKGSAMKFNWRANWEILLVFVIIIVGIVITTIAAIRSKDKHLLVTPGDESLAAYSNGGGIVELTSSVQVPALPQNDFQLQNGLDDTGQEDEAAHNSNLAASTRRPARPSTTAALSPQPSSAHRGDRKRSQSYRSTEAPSSGKGQAVSQASSLVTQTTTSRPADSLSQHDNYEATMSTEQTPSQSAVLRQSTPSRRDEQHRRFEQTLKSLFNGKLEDERRFAADSKQQQADEHFNDQLESQLENNQKSRVGSGTKHFSHATSSDQQPQQVAMQGPYELVATLQHIQPFNRDNHKMKLAHQQSQEAALKIDQMPSSSQPPPPADSTEELMTSYTRVPQNQPMNLTERNLPSAQFFNKAQGGADNNSTTAGDSDDSDLTRAHLDNFNSGQTVASLHQQNLRAYPSSLPLEMLLGELIKLSPQPTSRPLVDTQAGLDQPANSRPQYGILQQLRSLPGPLLALFQQQLPGSQQNSAGANGGGGSRGGLQTNGDFYANYHHMQPHNHDASESAQHYQRISMNPYGDLNSLVARSLRTTNPLPAFPPPKGVITTWVPPNMGGVSILQDAASTNNADFVASETAGFVRGVQDSGLQMAASDVNQQQQDQQVPSSESNSNQSHQTVGQVPKTTADTATKISREQQQAVAPTAATTPAGGKQPQTTSFDGASATQPVSVSPLVYMPQQGAGEISAGRAMPAPVLRNQINPAPTVVANGNSIQRYINQIQPLQQQPVRQMQRSDQAVESGPLTRLFTGNGLVNPIGAAQHQQGSHTLINNRQLAIQLKIPQDMTHQRAPTLVGNSPKGQSIQLNSIQGRVKRSIASGVGGKPSFEISNGDTEQARDEQEEYSDSSPLSIVTPDGRPLSAGAAQLAQARRSANKQTRGRASSSGGAGLDSASSQRETNHADFNDSSPVNHYATESAVGAGGRLRASTKSLGAAGAGGQRNGVKLSLDYENDRDSDRRNQKRRPMTKVSKGGERAKGTIKSRQGQANSKALRLQKLEAADSRLMSKLLGVASTNDELEDDLDGDDEESARERRKEELEDAEFGISNDERSNSPPNSMSNNADIGSNSDEINDTNQENQEVSRLTQDNSAANPAADRESADEVTPIRSAGSTDSNAYARRQQQQRSDVEFYGHPGEETRQLKYGILGSGNYEVVNGGIYPDIDESTAAVNSVANYVRKPGGGGNGAVLMAGLPKLINSVAAAAADDNRQEGRHRLGGPGFMWGASATSQTSDELGGQTLTHNPLLDLLDPVAHHQAAAAGQPIGDYYNQNLLAAQYLGSSGTSARTTHASRDAEPSPSNDLDEDEQRRIKTKRKRRPKQWSSSSEDHDEGYNSSTGDRKDDPMQEAQEKSQTNKLKTGFKKDMMTPMETLNDANNRIRSSLTSSGDSPQSQPDRKVNQFYSYHILPSKKVTIFSDQDLDSAPSDQVQRVTGTRPRLTSGRGYL